MYFIQAIASISHQDSFRSKDVYASLQKLNTESDVISPDYKDYIPSTALRRLSLVLRMGLTASMDCQQQMGEEFDAISVGTALGCLKDTEKFLVTIHTTTSDFLSPTAFIQSTHNTIGGQISLGLKNYAYNMTHTQNNLSFEVALLDALLCINEGKQNVLVGAADEKIDFLSLVQPDLIPDTYPLSSGASFFVLSPVKNETGIGVRSVYTQFNALDVQQDIFHFLENNELSVNDLDLVLYGGELPLTVSEKTETLDYLAYTGMHYSASAFALHMAHDYLAHREAKLALVINEICPGKLGLTLVEKQ